MAQSQLFVETAKHGYVYKQSKIFGVFKRRYIVMNNNKLYSYKSDGIFRRNQQQYTEVFDLSIYSNVENTVNKYYIKKFEFKLYSGTDYRRFQCESEFELKCWVNNIKEVHHRIKKNHLTLHFAGIKSPKSSITMNLVDAALITTVQTSLTVKDTILSLKNTIRKTYGIPSDKEILILYSHTIISTHQELTINHFHITNNSLLLLVLNADNHPHKPSLITGSLPFGFYSASSLSPSTPRMQRSRAYMDLSRLNASYRALSLSSETPRLIMSDSNSSLRTLSNVDNDNAMEYRNGFDVIMQEDNVLVYRMPLCGHWMNRDSLYQYALNTLIDHNNIYLKCPHSVDDEKKLDEYWWSCHRCTFNNTPYTRSCSMCGASKPVHQNSTLCNTKWDYMEIKKILTANMNGKQLELDHKLAMLELYIARNMVEKEYNVQKCSECNTLYYRENNDDNKKAKTRCLLCVDNEFCWCCGEKWTYHHLCDSSFRLELVEILKGADTKRIGDVGDVPSIRCCPNCCQLIKHSEACKHMKCEFCKTDFCFICLKQKRNGYWQCGQHSDVCPVASRQNVDTLPFKKKAFKLF